MGFLKNDHCKLCNARTKLLLKEGKEKHYWCSVAKACPYSKPIQQTKLQEENK